MPFRKAILVVHRWVGLLTGSIVLVVSLTGALYVFDQETYNLLHRDLVRVEPSDRPMRPASEIIVAGRAALGPEAPVSWIEGFGPGRAVEVHAYRWDDSARGLGYWNTIKLWKAAYLNPYTGEVLGSVDRRFGFFTVVRHMHQSLLLRHDVGHRIVGTAVLVFLGMLITGVVLWWPRNRAAVKQRIKVAWRAGRRRLQWDLHAVLGIYVLPIALIIAATGLVWSFKWWESGMYFLVSGDARDPWADEPEHKASLPGADSAALASAAPGSAPMDIAFREVMRRSRPGGNYWVTLPEGPDGVLEAAYQEPVRSGWVTWSGMSFDPHSGAVIHTDLFEDKDIRKRFGNSIYDIHVGRIFGWPTQILALLASLLCASLPVTGFLMWRGRSRAGRKPISTQTLERTAT